MKTEEKQLILKDLCGRLPYSPLVYLSNPMDSFDSELCTTVIEHLINEEYEVKPNGFPNQFMRFCCRHLKEYKVLDKAIHGIRRCESVKRAERYKEPTYCRVYNKDEKVEVFMPILEWSDDELKQFVDYYKVKCHPLYYDEKGNFRPERRLGCMCCPLASPSKRIEQFKQYPNMVKFYLRNGNIWLKSHTHLRLKNTKMCMNGL